MNNIRVCARELVEKKIIYAKKGHSRVWQLCCFSASLYDMVIWK